MSLYAVTLNTIPGPRRTTRPASTFIAPSAPGPTALRLTSTSELSATEWMVSDASTAVGNTSAVLGFIQLTAGTVSQGTFEVTKIGGSRIEFSTCLSLAEAVAVLSAKPLRRLILVGAPRRR